MRRLKIRLGDINADESSPIAQTVQHASVSLYPRYRDNAYYHDLALIKLLYPVTFNHYVQPACLYHYTIDPPTMFLSAWTKPFWIRPRVKIQIIEAVSLPRCRAEYSQFFAKVTTPGEVVDDQMCGGYTSQKSSMYYFLFLYAFSSGVCPVVYFHVQMPDYQNQLV